MTRRPRPFTLLAAFASALAALAHGPALALCGDGTVDPGEACDDGALGTVSVAWPLDLAAPSSPIAGIAALPGATLIASGDAVLVSAAGNPAQPLATFPGAPLRELLVGPDGIIYAASPSNDRIERLSQNGQKLGAYPIGGALFSPEALATAGPHLFVASARNSLGELRPIVRVSRLTGAHLGPFGEARGERALAFDSKGELLTIHGGTIARYSTTGQPRPPVTTIDGDLLSLRVAPDDSIFARARVDGLELLYRWAHDGTLLAVSELGESPDLTLDPSSAALALASADTLHLIAHTPSGRALVHLPIGNSDHLADACRLDCRLPRCGDGVRDNGEACDDGNALPGDGCTSCALEPGHVCLALSATTPDLCVPSCGDGVLDPGELCDDGNLDPDDGCSPFCAAEPGWLCLGQPSSCDALACGDALVAGLEECDDGPHEGGEDTAGDGCFQCRIEPGWACDANGCRRTCGDGTLDPGEDCDDGNLTTGDGCSAGCRAEPGYTCGASGCSPICGDGLVRGDEQCDLVSDGCLGCRLVPGWTCTPSTCTRTCGNARLDPGEDCDDGNTASNDGCSASCRVESGWTCSPPMAEPDPRPSACGATRCGDGIVAGAESCDDLNVTPGDGCDGTCQLEPGWVCDALGCRDTCGNGVLDPGELCDDGTSAGGDGCDPSCRVEAGWSCPLAGGACVATRCGDGIAAGDEECDDANTVADDGCASCRVEPGWVCDRLGCRQSCGNGIVEPGEGCDDGNLRPGDGCDARCRREPGFICAPLALGGCQTLCGDLIVAGDETCEDGNDEPDDGCDACALTPGWVCPPPARPDPNAPALVPRPCAPTCGNGELDPDEGCDHGDLEPGDGCGPGCTVEPGWRCGEDTCEAICGDARIVGAETCDDGNDEPFDGCDRCQLERGFVCDDGLGEPAFATCRETCGDGVLDVGEACDDGNLGLKDGCDANCRVEPGWACFDAPSLCDAAECGDGILAGFEACDDGNTEPGDGCGPGCAAELGWTCGPTGCLPICGDGRRLGAEACDDGNQLSGDGCTACGIEAGWTCTGAPGERSVCRPSEACGDGVRGGSEACDDGNDRAGDGCFECQVEPGWACTLNVCTELDDDGDGLSNNAELLLGTRPDDPDTDRDGLEDGDEVARGTDPLKRDTDGDGLDDGLEVLMGLDPLNPDTDGDGIRDGLDNCPTIPNPDQRDLDKDGVGSACDPDEIPVGVVVGGDCAGGDGSPGGLLSALAALALLLGARVLARGNRRRHRPPLAG